MEERDEPRNLRVFVDRIERCPDCNHHRFWRERGVFNQYIKKCCKCGKVIK